MDIKEINKFQFVPYLLVKINYWNILYRIYRRIDMDIIYTDRLVIREFTQVDIDKVFPLLSDPIVMKHCFGHLDIIGAQKWLNSTIESYKKYGYDFWAAYEKNADTFLGTIGLLNEEIDGKQEPCLAFMIGRKYWNKGYATEGAMACINYAFKSLKLEKLMATVEIENLQSISVLKKIGMKYIGETNISNKKVYIYLIKKTECHV